MRDAAPILARCAIRHSHVGAFAICARPLRHAGLCCPSDPPCETCMHPPALVCARCGDKPTELETRTVARLGGTHLAQRRREGVVGMGGFHRCEECGPWVRAETRPEQRQKALDQWRATRVEEAHR